MVRLKELQPHVENDISAASQQLHMIVTLCFALTQHAQLLQTVIETLRLVQCVRG